MKTRFRALGEYFGYPECCIKEFHRYLRQPKPEDRHRRPLHGTGYVPCAECAKLPLQTLLNQISDRRKCPVDFPFGQAFLTKKPLKNEWRLIRRRNP